MVNFKKGLCYLIFIQNYYIEGLTVLASKCFAVTTLTKDLLIEGYVIAGVSFYYCSVFTYYVMN